MPTRALLLCGDEKALAAVTQILSELGVAFEQVPDPASAGKRLASQRFDVILIDCDDMANATLAFDSVRQSSLNQNSLTLAIVDGKAGVPNAFRLGARLVLTKPVSLEQARGTLRNALAIHRKEGPSSKTAGAAATATEAKTQHPATAKPADVVPAPGTPIFSTPRPGQTPPADWQRPQPDAVASPLARAAAAGVGAPSQAPTEMASSAAAAPAPADIFKFRKQTASIAASTPSTTKVRPPEDDDLLMCELEGDLETKRKPTRLSRARGRVGSRKTSRSLLALLAVLLIGAGFYAAWTMEPGFRAAVLAQYGRLRHLITGTATSPQAPAAKPAAKQAPLQAPTKAVNPSPKANQEATAPASNAVAEGFLSKDKSAKAGDGSDTAGDSAKSPALPASASGSDAESDRGPLMVPAEVADKHVSHRVAPVYPDWARHKHLEGEVLLRASVNDDGSVDSVQVLDGHPRLAPAAVEAVRQWRYQIYYHNGQPSAFQTEVTVRFELPRKKPAN
ncbi:MAG TPA: TonB family protein [Terriglobales bacterium]|jgi:protein TonB|nr:TonB family protein [Terriglobales bacterium]